MSLITKESLESLEPQELANKPQAPKAYAVDPWILLISGTLILIGLLMVTSSSYPNALQRYNNGYYFLIRQSIYMVIGLVGGLFLFSMHTEKIESASPYIIIMVSTLLIAVLIPGIGREINGSMRWLSLGPINIQPAELAKFCTIIYVANYLKRHYQFLRNSFYVLISPLIVLSVAGVLLLLQPDFGSTVVILMICLGMLFMSGVSLLRFSLFLFSSIALMSVIIFAAPYRRARLTAFSNPWDDPLNKGFQLIQSLIAVGRGEVYGQGVGGSIQKLGYLPEAHTDFIFAVYAEETGIIGVIFLISLFLILFWRCLYIGYRAHKNLHVFPAFCAYGIGLWFIFQAFVNIGVVMGALPTKGITLPLISYGGSSLIVMMASIGFLLRIEIDTRTLNDYPIHLEKKTIVKKKKSAFPPNRRAVKKIFGWFK